MDPLTHTLVGANLASTRIGTKTRLATAACVIGANAPDIDVGAYFLGGDFAIGFRRGWTHGVLALVVLPLVLWACLMSWEWLRRRSSPDRDGQAGGRGFRPGWLLALCTLSILTHPFLDWLNVYGMRWLMPFDTTWFYGDSVFIMDPWLWLILAGAWLVPRRPSKQLVILWGVFAGLLALAVAGRAPRYLPVITTIAIILLVALLWKSRNGDAGRYRFGRISLAVASVYIAGMIGLHAMTIARVSDRLAAAGVGGELLLTGPLPVDSLQWDVLATDGDDYRYGTWSWWNRELTIDESRLPRAESSELFEIARHDPAISGFMRWVRYPWIETERVDGGVRVYILDARYARERSEGFGGASVVVPAGPE